jgi:uroporphyrinogen-III synthase
MTDPNLGGLRVVSFESRRATEIAELIRRHGGEPVSAPSMREVPLEDNREVQTYLDRLDAGAIDAVVLMTGVGLRTLVNAAAPQRVPAQVAVALRKARLIARGPKPVAALREIGLVADVLVPEPNTWREVLATLDAQWPVAGKRVAVHEYGVENTRFIEALVERGAEVERIRIYRWALPLDLGPLRGAIRAVIDAAVDAALFTSATQVYNLFEVAGDDADKLRAGFRRVLVASIGPVCSEALSEHGLRPDLEPEHPRMGHLVAAVARRGPELLRLKRAVPVGGGVRA